MGLTSLRKKYRLSLKNDMPPRDKYHFQVPPYPFNYPTRRLNMEEILAKFIDEGKRDHEEMEIFIKEFRTTSELLLKEQRNILSELKIKTFKKRKRYFSQAKTYFWEEPYAFKLCVDNIMRKCVSGSKTLKILAHCHSGPTGGHHRANVTPKKVYKSGFYWPSVLRTLMSDKVLLYNFHLKMCPGKLKSKWSGPNSVKTIYPYGAVEIINKNEFKFKVNGQRLKKYYKGDIDKKDDEVIEFKNAVT
nr:reverse transcriptase domain-containing protein [Tanacetum cinerariifolium]